MKRIVVTFDVNDDIHKKLKEYVRERGMTMQGLLTILVKRELAKAAEKESE